MQTALISATNSDTIYVAGGVHTGTCVAVITLTKSITLSGGWDGAVGGLVVRDPAAYPTTLDGERARRVVYISGNITPTVDGFIVTRGNATTVYCPFVGGCSSIYVLEAHPVIAHDVITDNIVAVFTNASGYGGEMFLRDATRAIIHSNLITSNAASTAYWGFGGGMWIGGEGSGLQVSFNQVFSNAAKTANMYGEGGGIHSGPDEALIQGNVIAGNRTSSNAVIGRGAGLVQLYGSTRYPGNLVQGNAGPYAVHLYHNQARFEGNRVVDNNTVGGVCLESGAGAGPLLVNNVVASNWTCAVYA